MTVAGVSSLHIRIMFVKERRVSCLSRPPTIICIAHSYNVSWEISALILALKHVGVLTAGLRHIGIADGEMFMPSVWSGVSLITSHLLICYRLAVG